MRRGERSAEWTDQAASVRRDVHALMASRGGLLLRCRWLEDEGGLEHPPGVGADFDRNVCSILVSRPGRAQGRSMSASPRSLLRAGFETPVPHRRHRGRCRLGYRKSTGPWRRLSERVSAPTLPCEDCSYLISAAAIRVLSQPRGAVGVPLADENSKAAACRLGNRRPGRGAPLNQVNHSCLYGRSRSALHPPTPVAASPFLRLSSGRPACPIG